MLKCNNVAHIFDGLDGKCQCSRDQNYTISEKYSPNSPYKHPMDLSDFSDYAIEVEHNKRVRSNTLAEISALQDRIDKLKKRLKEE